MQYFFVTNYIYTVTTCSETRKIGEHRNYLWAFSLYTLCAPSPESIACLSGLRQSLCGWCMDGGGLFCLLHPTRLVRGHGIGRRSPQQLDGRRRQGGSWGTSTANRSIEGGERWEIEQRSCNIGPWLSSAVSRAWPFGGAGLVTKTDSCSSRFIVDGGQIWRMAWLRAREMSF
jgi:hypothetical protein